MVLDKTDLDLAMFFNIASILRNRKMMDESILAVYLDAEKAFDRIDHDLLLYKLLLNGIYSHVHEHVKNICSESTCCCIKTE